MKCKTLILGLAAAILAGVAGLQVWQFGELRHELRRQNELADISNETLTELGAEALALEMSAYQADPAVWRGTLGKLPNTAANIRRRRDQLRSALPGLRSKLAAQWEELAAAGTEFRAVVKALAAQKDVGKRYLEALLALRRQLQPEDESGEFDPGTWNSLRGKVEEAVDKAAEAKRLRAQNPRRQKELAQTIDKLKAAREVHAPVKDVVESQKTKIANLKRKIAALEALRR